MSIHIFMLSKLFIGYFLLTPPPPTESADPDPIPSHRTMSFLWRMRTNSRFCAHVQIHIGLVDSLLQPPVKPSCSFLDTTMMFWKPNEKQKHIGTKS